jgi:hypothetical protein
MIAVLPCNDLNASASFYRLGFTRPDGKPVGRMTVPGHDAGGCMLNER